jgi:immunity protein 35 of polymorphic toxin system
MIVDRQEARAIATRYIDRLDARVAESDLLVLLDERTIEKPYGWIFFYTSKGWLETGDMKYAIAGNAPFLVERDTGEVRVFGTARSTEWYVEQYERGFQVGSIWMTSRPSIG